MSLCTNCGNPVPEEAKFCPVCGTPVAPAPDAEPAAAPVVEAPAQEIPAQEVPAGSWYQSADGQQQSAAAAAPVFATAKPPIGGVFEFYRKAFAVLAQKPIKLWGLSLLYLVIACVVGSLGALVPIISIPIVLVLSLGFTGVLLNGYYGKEVRSEQLFRPFRKEEVVRNGAGMCWMELWMMIWSFVPVMNVIKYYAYSFTPYILLTDKEITPTEALRKSMRMTDGYKAKLFWADLLIVVAFIVVMLVLTLLGQIRYIGWIFTIVLVLCYIAVYLFLPIFMGLVRTAYFDEISKLNKD